MRFFSFFSGALGLDLGFESAGFDCVVANENNRQACRTIRANRPNLNLIEGDIRQIDGHDLLRQYGTPDLIIGGPPCQPFSTAGNRQSGLDAEDSPMLHFLRLIEVCRPNCVVIENVRGLLSAPIVHRPHAERASLKKELTPSEQPGSALAMILIRLENAGLVPSFSLYNVANFGVPQSRERLVILAKRGEKVPHLAPTHSKANWRTFREATADLRSHTSTSLRPSQLEWIDQIPAGGNWRSLPAEHQAAALGGAYHSTGGRVGFLRRLAWDAPAPTLVTSPSMPATLLCHPTENRPLSVEEYKRLQGFPDDWEVTGSLADQYRQIGNAVPVAFANAIACHLLDQRARTSDLPTSRYRHTTESEWKAKFALT